MQTTLKNGQNVYFNGSWRASASLMAAIIDKVEACNGSVPFTELEKVYTITYNEGIATVRIIHAHSAKFPLCSIPYEQFLPDDALLGIAIKGGGEGVNVESLCGMPDEVADFRNELMATLMRSSLSTVGRASCDVCGRIVDSNDIVSVMAGGIETEACSACRHGHK